MPRIRTLLCVVFTFTAAATAHANEIGGISFPTSTSSEKAQAHFVRGATTLHSFGFKQAIEAFQAAQQADPDFAMAYWGESLCYNHPFLPEWDRETPQRVLRRLGATPAERLAKAGTPRERGFLAAVEALFFGEGDLHERRTAHMEAMQALHEAHSDDDEIAAFYALSLISAGGAAGPAGERKRIRSGAIALDLFGRDPDHPGAAHYTIHAFDDPIHAILALPAARRFASIAPAVSHARHMPSHIFIQLGMWEEVSRSNESAYQAAVDLWEPGDNAGDMTHALDWGQYGDLQRGDYARAKEWIATMEGIVERNPGQDRVAQALPRVRARYIVEARQWQTGPVKDDTPAPELLATGLSAIAKGETGLARRAAEALAKQADGAEGADTFYARTALPLRIMAEQVAGKLAIAEGDTEGGLARLARAVEVTEQMPLPRGAANPIKPAHELHGEALLAAGKPVEALAAFEESLLRMPRRPLSLLGLARASHRADAHARSDDAYRELVRVWAGRDFPELAEARGHLENPH